MSFLDCNIWSINDSIMDDNGFTIVKRVYPYNSDTDEFNNPIPPGFIQIPEFCIKNLHLLQELDYNFINQHAIPIIRKDELDEWTIDLKYYEDTYLQYSRSQ
jgi:restriction endonuclease S subunit